MFRKADTRFSKDPAWKLVGFAFYVALAWYVISDWHSFLGWLLVSVVHVVLAAICLILLALLTLFIERGD